ncbi:endonuclease III [Desulforhabdus amnigena]|jgi:endonuclease-3|uniref:Endonuclease III n=1 Tax=Desulforhabdus amnigena TaxID=40218 RepID=A0A9W6L8W1_9BACT|nr:endonuclease III [Desulforhabdus amnigena]NLJ28296.1 endonuclease III [Deltaproteobacteria bacterium]GLI36118.1 endonuclease III [Desulforhabdus amnigena]
MPKKKTSKSHLSLPPLEKRIGPILDLLDRLYPDAGCTLNYENPLQLLISTILSAQCTDERVNQVTPALFKKYASARDFAQAPLEELENDIKSTGFYRNKAKNIQACCHILDERFGGEVPPDLEILVTLPGIGRKTANVVLGNVFQIPGIVVDTHVGRVSQRLGLTAHKDPLKIEQDLMALIPRERWILFCHQLIQHGRKICLARKPKTSICPLSPYCEYAAEHSDEEAREITADTV